jgi:pimeloyl-ACP methyl ester carboxylesterase
MLRAYQNRSEWQEVRQATDVFSFRYDSDGRIYPNATKLAQNIQTLRDTFNYDSVIVVTHSMGGIVAVEARKQVNNLNPVMGIVTHSAPFMGVIFECNQTGPISWTGVSPSGQECKNAAGGIAEVIDSAAPPGGMLDLTSYYDRDTSDNKVPNPFLSDLWQTPADFGDIYAIYGSSRDTASWPGSIEENRDWFDSFLYHFERKYRNEGWGYNDGLVPEASAVTATNLSMTQLLGPISTISVPRNHVKSTGCPRCYDALTNGGYDTKLNLTRDGIKSFLPQPIAPDAPAPIIWQIVAEEFGPLTNPVPAVNRIQHLVLNGSGLHSNARVTLTSSSAIHEVPFYRTYTERDIYIGI